MKRALLSMRMLLMNSPELFDVSRQAAKVRLIDLGYFKAEGAYPFVDGQYVRGYSFEAGALDKNQTFTIPYADLFKAYCLDREFKKLIDSGQFVFADRHLVLNNEKYIARDQTGNATLSEYALSHMDECCVVFSKGYSYQSKYQGARYYTQFMRNAAPVENQVEYSFELNAHNKALLDQIKNAKRRSEALAADIPAPLPRRWLRCRRKESSQISSWLTARLLVKRPFSG